MRIVHLADTHLGYRQFSAKLDPVRKLGQRECDVYDAWHRAVDTAIELRPDAVVHAGDLFDSSRPTPRALAEALDGLGRLRDAGLPVVVIAGNHSTPRFRSGGSVFEVLERFGVEAVWSGPRTVRVGKLAIHAVPHEHDPERLAEHVAAVPPDPAAAANVLVLHAGLEHVKQGYGEINEVVLDPELLARARYDYIALGHLHRFQTPLANAVYPGSPERLDFADVDGDKAVLEVDLSVGAGGRDFLRRHPLEVRPMHDLAIRCAGAGAGAVLDSIRDALPADGLEGSVVRVRLEGIARDVHHGLDFAGIDALLAPCLHHVIRVAYAGGDSGGEAHELGFAAFARQAMPPGVDAGAVVTLAQRYLGDAAAEEAEEDA